MRHLLLPAACALLLAACVTAQDPSLADADLEPKAPEATSLLGQPLYALPPSDDTAPLLGNLDSARTAQALNPSADNLIWVGRRYGYLWEYRNAIDVFTRGIEQYPDDPRFYRHRGHRYISVREFDNAIADLKKAVELIEGQPDEVEPDGAPNAANIPTSTLHFNVWYHLGLAHYLKGEFEQALDAYRACLEVSDNNDAQVATRDWLYMTLRRLGRDEEARQVLTPITPDMELLENTSYHRRLLMYKGLLPPDSLLNLDEAELLDIATQGYGVGNWMLCNGDTARAVAVFDRIVEGSYWPAFAFIAAEADLVRLRE